MANIEAMVVYIANLLWGDWLLCALIGLGLWYTCITGGIQVRFLRLIRKGIFSKGHEKSESHDKGCTSWQSLCASLGSCVGSGNIVGVSTAILYGGAGALFWMWVAAFFGMATKFGEIVLGVKYRGHDKKGNIVGGSMYYISQRLGWHKMALAVAGLLFVQNSGATLIQSNTIAQVASSAFFISPQICALIVAAIIFLAISGGFKRLIHIMQSIVPLMATLYIGGGILVLIMFSREIPHIFSLIVEQALSIEAATGAVLGHTMKEAMRYGVARGLYSNEAGEGTAPVLHAAAQVDHPVRQGFYGIIEVFVDTFLICSTTGLVVLLTGANLHHSNAVTLTAVAFDTVYPGLRYIMYISLILFAGTSIMNQWYFGYVSLTFLGKEHWNSWYRYVFPVLIVLGSLGTVQMVWAIQDIALAFLILPNILAMFMLSGEVRRLTKEFLNPKNGYLLDKSDAQKT